MTSDAPAHFTDEAIAAAVANILGIADSMAKAAGQPTPTSRLMRIVGPAFLEWMLREQAHGSNNGAVLAGAGSVFGFLTAYVIQECPDEDKQWALDEMGAITAKMLNLTLKVLAESNELIMAEPGGHA